jgi:hypothetical protein
MRGGTGGPLRRTSRRCISTLLRASASSSRPSGDSIARPPRARWINSPPTDRSSALICLLIEGWEMPSWSAALRMLPASATAMKSSSWRVVVTRKK